MRILKTNMISSFYRLFYLTVLILIILFLIGCTKEASKSDAWHAVMDYIQEENNYDRIEFPAKYDKHLIELNRNKFEVKAYYEAILGPCCDSMVKFYFSCIVEYRFGEYIVSSFKY